MGCHGSMLLMVCGEKNHVPYLRDNLCCKKATEYRILFLLIKCSVERLLRINQSTSLIYFQIFF